MKTSKITLTKSVIAALLLMAFSSPAFAKTSISIGFGFGNQHNNRGHRNNRSHRPNQRFDRGRRNDRFIRHRPRIRYNRRGYSSRRNNIVLGGGFSYSNRGQSYYVYATPTIIRRSPVIVEEKTVIVSTNSPQVVQQVEYDEDTQALLETLRYRKTELLDQLKTGYKDQRKDAIKELAGFSFDDEVRQALENVLLLDPDAELRQEVIRVFAQVNNKKALPTLEKARVEDWSQEVRKEADKAIKSIKEN